MTETSHKSTEPTANHGLLAPGTARDRALIVILSDTHMAGGADDPLEDHVWRGSPLKRFIDQLARSEEGQVGGVELILNGDFLEFVQAAPEVYDSRRQLWCSEDESLLKLGAILMGHANIFEALRCFQEAGNAVTVMAGNHDIDLHWPRVRERLRKDAGPLRFELGREWFSRYDGKLRIAHGHQVDPANSFPGWAAGVIHIEDGAERLENCPGTRFLVSYINDRDAEYPFIDNIKPFARMVQVLLREDPKGATWAILLLLRFLGTTDHGTLLSAGDAAPAIFEALEKDDFADRVLAIYRSIMGEDLTREAFRQRLADASALESFLLETLAQGRLEELPSPPPSAVLGVDDEAGEGGGGHLLGLGKERMINVVELLRDEAEKQAEQGAQVIVCGHTHVPDRVVRPNYVYFNTGSWTRYLHLGKDHEVTLEQLRDQESFPYELRAVHVRPGKGDRLEAEMKIFEQHAGVA